MKLSLQDRGLAVNLAAPIFITFLALSPINSDSQEIPEQHNQQVSSLSSQQNVTTKNSTPQQLSDIWAQQESALSESESADVSAAYSAAIVHAMARSASMRVYHLDLHSYRPAAKYSGDPKFVDSENPTHVMRCRKDLLYYKQALESVASADPNSDKISLDRLRLADSYGRPEAGALMGSQFWLGSYEQCLGIELKRGDQAEPINSQYCLGLAHFPSWNPSSTKTALRVGLCLPVTCTSSMISENSQLLGTVERMMKYQIGETRPYSQLKLHEVYCLPHETSPVRQYSASTYAFFAVIGAFVATCVIATVVDYHETKSQADNLIKAPQGARYWRTIVVESFSLTRNLTKFLQLREDSPQDAKQVQANHLREQLNEPSTSDDDWVYDRGTFLNSISGLKCVGLLWIIGAHVFMVSPITSNNILTSDKLTKTLTADLYLAAHLVVDTFFAFSGMVAAFFLFKAGLDRISFKNWVALTIHRYWRLTPIYLLCYWFAKSVSHLLNSGPFWDYMTSEQSPRLNCARESWLDAVLHLSDFKSPKDHCVPFAWFIANGIKFWIVTPIFLILINKSIRQGYMTTISAILTNMVLVGTLAMRCNLDINSVIDFKPESANDMLNNMGEVYSRPYSRVGAYLVGLLAGHIMYMVDTQQLRIKFSRNSKKVIWTLVSICAILLTFAMRIANSAKVDPEALPVVFAVASAIMRPLWALCSCWLVFALAHNQAKWLSRFLTANCWKIFVKLSFCAYLAQGEVIAQVYLSPTHAATFTYFDMISRPMVVTVITILVSILMLLILEYPLIGIEELILPKRTNNSSSSLVGEAEKSKSEKLKQT